MDSFVFTVQNLCLPIEQFFDFLALFAENVLSDIGTKLLLVAEFIGLGLEKLVDSLLKKVLSFLDTSNLLLSNFSKSIQKLISRYFHVFSLF